MTGDVVFGAKPVAGGFADGKHGRNYANQGSGSSNISKSTIGRTKSGGQAG